MKPHSLSPLLDKVYASHESQGLYHWRPTTFKSGPRVAVKKENGNKCRNTTVPYCTRQIIMYSIKMFLNYQLDRLCFGVPAQQINNDSES